MASDVSEIIFAGPRMEGGPLNPSEQSIFKNIVALVATLSKMQSSLPESQKRHEVIRYSKLLERTGTHKTKVIRCHFVAFSKFIYENRESIQALDNSTLKGEIVFSEKISLPLSKIFVSPKENETIWKYLLMIAIQMNPGDEEYKNALRSLRKASGKPVSDGSNESQLLKNVINDIKKTAKGGSEDDPLGTVVNILKDGTLAKHFESARDQIKAGKMTVEGFVGAFQGLMSGMGEALPGGMVPAPLTSMLDNIGTMTSLQGDVSAEAREAGRTIGLETGGEMIREMESSAPIPAPASEKPAERDLEKEVEKDLEKM